MAKSKKPRKLINSDKINNKKSSLKNETTEKKINPFELQVNREKFDILGRHHKHDRGMPGVSRGKAIKKRIETLGKEFKNLHKTNKFDDYRFGRNEEPDQELVANAKFVANHMAEFRTRKQDIFNLNDDEVLTHRGQTLEEIEKFDDPIGNSDDSEDEELNAEFTEAAHFGGENNEGDRKNAIDQMIADSKRKKMEISKEKEEVYQLTNKLDENYKDLIPLLGKYSKNSNIKAAQDDYDRVMREMIFEPRGEVTDKLISEEEILKKEKEKLEQLENERLARMRGEEFEQIVKPTHKSADALDDAYFIGGSDDGNDEDEKILAYNINEEDLDNENINIDENEIPAEADDEINVNKEEVDDGHESSDDEEDEDEENEDEEDDESEDNLSDLKENDLESEEEIEEKVVSNMKKQETDTPNRSALKIESKKINELPYTYAMPANYEELEKLLSNQSPQCQKIIVERILKCNHPKLDGSNYILIPGFLKNLLNYIGNQFNKTENIQIAFKVLDMQMTNLYDITKIIPDQNSQIFIDHLHDKYNEYKKNPKQFPTLSVLILFKIISNLFSTSDFRHPVVTLAFVFISHILSKVKVKFRRDCAQGLFICTILLEYTELSKRFLPACFNYLLGIIYLSIPKRPIEILKIVPPFSSSGPLSIILALDKFYNAGEELLNAKDLVEYDIDESFKIRALNTTVKILKDFMDIVEDNVGSGYLAEPFIELLDKLPLENYPEFIEKNIKAVKEVLIKQTQKPLKKITAIIRKPKALRLMEPRIEKVYDDKRRPKLSKEKEMRKILEHKVKRETKGALREIRRDNEFINKLKHKQQLASDLERREKVKRIYSEASMQQGELNELARSKKKTKF